MPPPTVSGSSRITIATQLGKGGKTPLYSRRKPSFGRSVTTTRNRDARINPVSRPAGESHLRTPERLSRRGSDFSVPRRGRKYRIDVFRVEYRVKPGTKLGGGRGRDTFPDRVRNGSETPSQQPQQCL